MIARFNRRGYHKRYGVTTVVLRHAMTPRHIVVDLEDHREPKKQGPTMRGHHTQKLCSLLHPHHCPKDRSSEIDDSLSLADAERCPSVRMGDHAWCKITHGVLKHDLTPSQPHQNSSNIKQPRGGSASPVQ